MATKAVSLETPLWRNYRQAVESLTHRLNIEDLDKLVIGRRGDLAAVLCPSQVRQALYAKTSNSSNTYSSFLRETIHTTLLYYIYY